MSITENKPESPPACPHCAFIETLGPPQSNREYWIITEIFVYLHGGKDYCDWKEKKDVCPECHGSKEIWDDLDGPNRKGWAPCPLCSRKEDHQ